MAEMSFSLKELHEVERICDELDPETHELTAFHIRRVRDLGDRLDLIAFIRKCIRGELMVGIAARAMCDELMRRGFATHGGVRGLLHEDWLERYTPMGIRGAVFSYNFGRAGDDYVLALQIMNKWWGTDDPEVYKTVYDLVDLAHDRMFGSVEVNA